METTQFNWLERTELLIGEEGITKLANANILLVGLGGVGSFAGEFLVRAGLGKITIIDGDTVDGTNINRQLQALHSTVGMGKADLLKNRYIDINPKIIINTVNQFLEPDDMEALLKREQFDFVLDCIDSLSPKLMMIELASKNKIKIISSMGAGGKMDPTKMRIADIYDTRECKFAQKIRKALRYRKVKRGITAIYSEEIQPKEALKLTDGSRYKRSFYGTISYMPALFGLYVASEAIRKIIGGVESIAIPTNEIED
jgi:tRNA threonylcarbamoyladenosine dehydratase